jgi:hypothetical protein
MGQFPTERDRFTWASGVRVPFGKYRGQTISRIGTTADGLKWLDLARGAGIKDATLAEAVTVYLSHPQVARELSEAIGY